HITTYTLIHMVTYFIQVHACVHTPRHTHTHTQTYKNRHTRAHTHIHIHMHTHMCQQFTVLHSPVTFTCAKHIKSVMSETCSITRSWSDFPCFFCFFLSFSCVCVPCVSGCYPVTLYCSVWRHST